MLHPPDAVQPELVGIAQWISEARSSNGEIDDDAPPEIAFQVRDDWQGEGLGSYLFQKLVERARALGLQNLKADVLGDNRGMNAIFKKSGVPYVTSSDFGVISYRFRLDDENSSSNN